MACIKVRDSASSAIRRYMLKSKEIDDTSLEELHGYVALLEEQWTRFKTAQEEVEMTCGSESSAIADEARGQAESWYIQAYSNLHHRLNTLAASAQISSTNNAQINVSQQFTRIPLPKIELPSFDGNATEWVSFHDSFKALVDDNAQLSPAQKLQYLRTCLKGEALLVISNFSISNANYAEAWQMLKSRYEVLRVIVDKHLLALFSVERAIGDSDGAIKAVLDAVLQHTRALGALDRPVAFWDDILVHLVVSKLHFDTRKQWELSLKGTELPTFEQLRSFLEIRCRSLQMVNSPSDGLKAYNKTTIKKPHGRSATALHVRTPSPQPQQKAQSCLFCNNAHKIYTCKGFQLLDANSKLNFVKQKSACLNCLSAGHSEAKCRSSSSCRICLGRHHTSLHNACSPSFTASKTPQSPHLPASTMSTALSTPENNNVAATSTSTHHAFQSLPMSSAKEATPLHEKTLLLGTAEVRVRDYSGRWQPARALFDNGSHTTFISETCLQRLRLPRRPSSVTVTGIGATQGGQTRGESTIMIAPRSFLQSFNVNALILSKLTNDLPTIPVTSTWAHVEGLELADPSFGKPGPIDILIGVDAMVDFLLPDIRKGTPDTPLAHKTVFGWILFGSAKISSPPAVQMQGMFCSLRLEKIIHRFWDLDETPREKFLTAEEDYCEEHFRKTHERDVDGRFIVQFPLKSTVSLGDSKQTAVRSFVKMEKRFAANPQLHREYAAFMQELLEMRHMEQVNDIATNSFYMPHHPVIKETSTTTKLRVVFNASMKSTTGYSLNDALMVGPQLQDDLFTILTRFRSHRYAMTADIAKMYRQVRVSDDCVNYQRIVWRNSPDEPLLDYRLLRVTYGLASASHLAVRALQETGRQAASTHPFSSQTVLRDFYMDDLLTGASSEETLVQMYREISDILAKGCFELRKWATNCRKLADSFPDNAKRVSHYLADRDEVRALGLIWDTEGDYFLFAVNFNDAPAVFTKRNFLADSSTLFDPLGLIVPCTIKAKIWFQQIWTSGVDWDQEVPSQIAEQWLKHREGLTRLASMRLNRWIGVGQVGSTTELHIFADASERAYAAVLYARTRTSDNSIHISLVSARARVAPLKSISLPRLELCAAHLAAKLYRLVAASFDVSAFKVFAWSDSTVTLAWLQGHPSRWTTFVANRVADIQEVLPAEVWSHVRSECNPADCASRGASPAELLENRLWWQGPHWLNAMGIIQQPAKDEQQTTDLELRSPAAHTATSHECWDIFEKYSSYSKLRRVTAYALRFLYNLRNSIRKTGVLIIRELREAELVLIRKKQPLPVRSSLLRLQPFLDRKDILCVGGRLKNADASVDVRHPIILPKGSRLAKLIIIDIHIFTLHGGPQLMSALLQQRFWVVAARRLVRKVYHSCVKCTRWNHVTRQQAMADLPKVRVTQARCFYRSAVDMAGPYLYKMAPGRGSKSIKGYLCSFICMATGAMHLEFVGDLTSVAFLNAFKRFINRRGFCGEMHSDNGTNFVGAEKELQRMLMHCRNDEAFSSYLSELQIEWHFNAPRAPHMGGFWEAGIKRVKYHLKRCLGETLLTFEELSTLLTEVESCVNSRPLCAPSTDVGDLVALTPGHFIIGSPLRSLPEPNTRDFVGNLGQRWQVLVAMRQHFWRRWKAEYLVSLQRRTKWFRPTRNFQEGDIVVIREDNTPPSNWKLARVTSCNPGADGLVRVVRLRTAGANCVRPICKLVLLPAHESIFASD